MNFSDVQISEKPIFVRLVESGFFVLVPNRIVKNPEPEKKEEKK